MEFLCDQLKAFINHILKTLLVSINTKNEGIFSFPFYWFRMTFYSYF